MAKGRKVVGDQNSEELDRLRRLVHALLVMLRNAGDDLANATADASVTNIGAGLRDAIDSGVDSPATGYTGSNLRVEGVVPTPTHPKRRAATPGRVEDLTDADLPPRAPAPPAP